MRQRILKIFANARGYCGVVLSRRGKTYSRAVHQLVAEAFLEQKPGYEVNHINGEKSDNRVDNLEMITRAENMAHAREMGLTAKGEEHGLAKITEVDVLQIRAARKAGKKLKSIAIEFGISREHAGAIASGKYWSHLPL